MHERVLQRGLSEKKDDTMSLRHGRIMIVMAGAALILGGAASARTIDPETALPPGDEFVLGTTPPVKWGDPALGTGAAVTYSFMPGGLRVESGNTTDDLSSFMPKGYKAEIASAFDAWQSVADITFTEVPDPGVNWQSGGAEASDIRIAGHAFDGRGGVLAHGFFPPRTFGRGSGDLHFDSAEPWKIGFGGRGFDIFQVAAHEIGHALGLGHECGNHRPDATCNKALMNPFYSESVRGLQDDDIAGVQAIYGAPVVAPVPLPASLPLIGGGLALLFALGRRRARARIM